MTRHEAAVPLLEAVTVTRNEKVADDVFTLRIRAPYLASRIVGGQFIHLRLNAHGTLLRRPLSVCQVAGDELVLYYALVGIGTRHLAEKPVGDTSMDALGPIGNAWPVDASVSAPLLVGGGLGIAPLGMLAHHFRDADIAVTLIQGALNQHRLITLDDHHNVARDLRVATDDGSSGYHGFVTDLVRDALAERAYDRVFVCGPEPMQEAVSALTAEAGVRTFVSFERRMACGIGACLGCVFPTISGLKRACVDGPVIDAREVLWHEAINSRVN